MKRQLQKIFQPKSIAAIGASNKKGGVGYSLMKNLLSGGFVGNIYPVNFKQNVIQGVPSYKSVLDIEEPIDLAIIATPAPTVPKILEECGEAGIKGVVIISAGFKEAGEAGNKMFRQISATAEKYNIRIVGPNCVGFLNPALGINASFLTKMPLPGGVALISQSGALCASILDWAIDQNVGFSNFVSVGSMVDVDFADLIDYFGSDENTSCILIYMESLTDARRFMSAARAFSNRKPIIILKSGKSSAGAIAAASHTGSLAGNDAVFNAAFRRAGIIRVDTIAQLFHSAQALSMQPRPRGNRLTIVTNAGGPGVLATDYLMGNGGQIAKLSDDTYQKLDGFLSAHWSHNNPVDVLGDANAKTYSDAVNICLHDENTDGVLAILTTQDMTDPAHVAEELAALNIPKSKTLLACWMGESDVQVGRNVLEKAKIPHYRYPESAVDVFLKMYDSSNNLKLLQETPPAIPQNFQPDKTKAKKLLKSIRAEGRLQLKESEAKELLTYYDIPVAPSEVVKSSEQAVKVAEEIGFPIVMKIVSPDIGHKTEVGGVVLNITSSTEAEQAYLSIMENVTKHSREAKIEGVLVEKMISKRYELLIGATKDPIFGPAVVFGMGGVMVELLKDTNMGLPPLNMALAQRIIENTKAFKMINGFRGMPKVDIEALQFLLVKFSYLLMDFPILKEIDINPYAVDEHGGYALDAHIVLDETVDLDQKNNLDHLVITPYPIKYQKNIELENGEKYLLRPIRPEDEPLEAEMFTRVSQESIYYRFMGFIPKINHDFLVNFTQIDYDREMAIIAEVDTPKGKKMAGVARIVCDAWKETAEFAIVVADPWQGNGLGNEMTDYILEIAKDMKVKKVVASVLQANHVMVSMFQKRGFTHKKSDDFQEYVMEYDLVGKDDKSKSTLKKTQTVD